MKQLFAFDRPGHTPRGLAAVCALLLCACAESLAAPPAPPFNTRFAAIAFHDVVDSNSQLDDDALTSDRLVAFFDWLRGNGWTAVSIDDVERARRGEKPLPPRAVLLTFDDGYRSLYTRVYPLALAYRTPIVAALVGQWMDAPAGGTVRYGSRDVPRERFISWDEAREMQRSGLVEFALHSYALHREVPGNPQGNTMPAATTRTFVAATGTGPGYETEAAFADRLRTDLARGVSLLQRELGRAPRTLVWPYGRYGATGVHAAQAVGLRYALTLDVGPADARQPLAIARYLPTANPSLAELVGNLQYDPNEIAVQRLACVDPASLWSSDAAEADARLGRLIERVRTLGLTGVVVDALQRDAAGRPVAAWFPTSELPLAGDLLSRIAWQVQTRGGVAVFVRLPHREALAALRGDEQRALHLYADLGAMVPLSGWVLEGTAPMPASAVAFQDPPPLFGDAARTQRGWATWVLRERRAAQLARLQAEGGADSLAWRAFATLDAARPALQLLWLTAAAPADGANGTAVVPHPLADLTLANVQAPATPEFGPRVAPWLRSSVPPDARHLAAGAKTHLRAGGLSIGWCPDDAQADRPEAAAVAPAVSSSTFPARR